MLLFTLILFWTFVSLLSNPIMNTMFLFIVIPYWAHTNPVLNPHFHSTFTSFFLHTNPVLNPHIHSSFTSFYSFYEPIHASLHSNPIMNPGFSYSFLISVWRGSAYIQYIQYTRRDYTRLKIVTSSLHIILFRTVM